MHLGRRRAVLPAGGFLVLHTRALPGHLVTLLRRLVRRFNLLEVVGCQTLVLVEELHALVLVLPLLVVDARLFQLLWPEPRLSLLVGCLRRIRLRRSGVVGIAIVRRIQFRQHLALRNRLALFHKNSRHPSGNLECGLSGHIGLHRPAGRHGNRLLNSIGHAHAHRNRLVGR